MEENNNNIVIYQTDDGTTKIDVKPEDKTVWLAQQQIADLYDATKQNISLHVKNIFDEEVACPEDPLSTLNFSYNSPR